MNTKASQEIAKNYIQQTGRLYRFQTQFSGTWDADMKILSHMLCPAGEADWIPGWTADVLHSDNGGYVSEQCIFRTDQTNKDWGAGLWYFTEYSAGNLLKVVVYTPTWIMHLRIKSQKNADGTISGLWNFTGSAITESGNKDVKKFEKGLALQKNALPIAVGYYMENGKKIKKSVLIPKLLKKLIFEQ